MPRMPSMPQFVLVSGVACGWHANDMAWAACGPLRPVGDIYVVLHNTTIPLFLTTTKPPEVSILIGLHFSTKLIYFS